MSRWWQATPRREPAWPIGDLALRPATREWLAAAVVLADLAAFVSIYRTRVHSRKAKAVWVVIVLLLPLLGALAWFALGRERRGGRRN